MWPLKQAEGLNIPLKSIDQVDFVDVTVDGADEVDSQFNGIKGGGGALLMEKGGRNTIKRIHLGGGWKQAGRKTRCF